MKTTRGEQDDLPPGLSAPARRALAQAGIARLEQLAGMTAAELLKLHGMGPKTIGPLRAALAARGLTFAGEQTGEPGNGGLGDNRVDAPTYLTSR